MISKDPWVHWKKCSVETNILICHTLGDLSHLFHWQRQFSQLDEKAGDCRNRWWRQCWAHEECVCLSSKVAFVLWGSFFITDQKSITDSKDQLNHPLQFYCRHYLVKCNTCHTSLYHTYTQRMEVAFFVCMKHVIPLKSIKTILSLFDSGWLQICQ